MYVPGHNMKCFVVMPSSVRAPFGQSYEDPSHFHHVYDYLFSPAIKASGLEPISPISSGSDLIHADIIRNLNEAEVVLGDLSTLNANVMFELGIRTALNKPVCLVADNLTTQMPF